jgi:hypothetical protein
MRTYDPSAGTLYIRMTREGDPYASPRTVNRLPRDYANKSLRARLRHTNVIARRLTSGDSGDVRQLGVAEEASDDLR